MSSFNERIWLAVCSSVHVHVSTLRGGLTYSRANECAEAGAKVWNACFEVQASPHEDGSVRKVVYGVLLVSFTEKHR